MTYMACPSAEECHSSDFKLVEDGRIVCADSDCGRTFGQWKQDEPEPARTPPAGPGIQLDPAEVAAWLKDARPDDNLSPDTRDSIEARIRRLQQEATGGPRP